MFLAQTFFYNEVLLNLLQIVRPQRVEEGQPQQYLVRATSKSSTLNVQSLQIKVFF